jgi:hypothetical protein
MRRGDQVSTTLGLQRNDMAGFDTVGYDVGATRKTVVTTVVTNRKRCSNFEHKCNKRSSTSGPQAARTPIGALAIRAK